MQKKKWLNSKDLEKNRQQKVKKVSVYAYTHIHNLSKYLRTRFNKIFLGVESESM